MALEMRLDCRLRCRRILAGDEAHGELGMPLGGRDGLVALPRIAAPHPVHLDRRAERGALPNRVCVVSERTCAKLRVPGGLVERQRCAFRAQRVGQATALFSRNVQNRLLKFHQNLI